MRQVFSAFFRALRDLFQLKVLWIVVWPTLVSILLWVGLVSFFGPTFSNWTTDGLAAMGAQEWLASLNSEWILSGIQGAIHLLVFIPLVVITALIITAIFSMPALINLVASRYYPELKYAYGGTVIGNLLNALIAITIFLVIWVVTLPLWLVGIGIIVPFVAAAYLNQQLFRYDALSEHATSQEIKVLLATNRTPSWVLGLITGMLQFLPVLNLFAPVFAALAFIHFELARLSVARSASDSSSSKTATQLE